MGEVYHSPLYGPIGFDGVVIHHPFVIPLAEAFRSFLYAFLAFSCLKSAQLISFLGFFCIMRESYTLSSRWIVSLTSTIQEIVKYNYAVSCHRCRILRKKKKQAARIMP